MSKETDANGEWEVTTQPNGVKIRLLTKPSQAFSDKQAAFTPPPEPQKSAKQVMIEKGQATENDFNI